MLLEKLGKEKYFGYLSNGVFSDRYLLNLILVMKFYTNYQEYWEVGNIIALDNIG